jgi:chromosome segregation ATPase
MMSDHKLLLDAKTQLEKELNQDMGSLSVQFANQSGMIEELNDYLKTKASIEAFEALATNLSQTKEHKADLQESKDKLQSALEDLQ